VWTLLDSGRPKFDRDTYKILARHVGRMVPLAPAAPQPARLR
jgi:hypothetical protein